MEAAGAAERFVKGKGKTLAAAAGAACSAQEAQHDAIAGAITHFENVVMERPTVKALAKPLTDKQARKMMDDGGFISVVVPLSIGDLGVGVECLNDAVSNMVLGDPSGLEDILFRPVGVKGEDVLVEVTGNVRNWLLD